MWIYLLLFSGLFMGWSLGTNDAANAFGTAVATRVIKYRTAVIIIAVMVVLGAAVQGKGNINKLSELATSNEVITSQEDVADIEDDEDELKGARLKSTLKAAIIFACAALTVFVMSYMKFPVSANQSITGAIIGWGLFHADYSDPEVLATNLPQIGKFAITWLINPLGAAVISFILVFFAKKFLENRILGMSHYDTFIKCGYLIAGAVAAYSIGVNSSASVTALYYDATGAGVNLLSSATLTAVIGGVAIAVGVLTFSKRVMMTVGGSIADLNQVEGFLVIISMALTILSMEKLMGIPVSTSQAVVGAVIGAGLVTSIKTKSLANVNFKVFGRIGIAWVSSPTVAGLLTYLVAVATQG